MYDSLEYSDCQQTAKREEEKSMGTRKRHPWFKSGRMTHFLCPNSMSQNLIIGPYLIACKPGDHSLALCLERKERMGLCHDISTSVIHLGYNEI